jgi:hypothetical protein
MQLSTQCETYGRFTSALPELASRQRESIIADLSHSGDFMLTKIPASNPKSSSCQRARNRCSTSGVPSAPEENSIGGFFAAALYLRMAEGQRFPAQENL